MKTALTILACLFAFANSGYSQKKSGSKNGQLIFTHQEYNTFDEALPNAITEVKDGDALWLYVRLPKPIGAYTNVQKFTDKEGKLVENVSFMMIYSGAKLAEQPVFIKGGEKAANGMVMNKGYVAYLDSIDPDKTTDLKLCLSSYIRHKSSWVFLKAVGAGEAGKWEAGLRLQGKDEVILAKAQLTSHVENGVPLYRKAWKEYETILEKGDIADNVLPPTGAFTDAAVKAAIIKDAKTSGKAAEKVVFTQDAWSEYVSQELVNQKERKIIGYMTYKKNGQCMYDMAEVTQKLVAGKWGSSLVRFYHTDTPIVCPMAK